MLHFLCSAHPSRVLYICENFMEVSQIVFKLQSGHKYMAEMAMFNVQRVITPKVGKSELQFTSSACCFTEL